MNERGLGDTGWRGPVDNQRQRSGLEADLGVVVDGGGHYCSCLTCLPSSENESCSISAWWIRGPPSPGPVTGAGVESHRCVLCSLDAVGPVPAPTLLPLCLFLLHVQQGGPVICHSAASALAGLLSPCPIFPSVLSGWTLSSPKSHLCVCTNCGGAPSTLEPRQSHSKQGSQIHSHPCSLLVFLGMFVPVVSLFKTPMKEFPSQLEIPGAVLDLLCLRDSPGDPALPLCSGLWLSFL